MTEPQPPRPDPDPQERSPAPTAESLERRRAEWLQAWPELGDLEAREFWANLRLRWTCHSNAIEDNSLAYRDTSLLLLFGETEWATGRPVTHSQVNSLWALVPVRLSS